MAKGLPIVSEGECNGLFVIFTSEEGYIRVNEVDGAEVTQRLLNGLKDGVPIIM